MEKSVQQQILSEINSKNIINLKSILDKNPSFDINFPFPPEKRTALHISALTGNTNCVSALLSHPLINIDALDSKGNTPLHLSSNSSGNIQIVNLLLNNGSDPFIQNDHRSRPIDLCSNPEIKTLLSVAMVSKETNNHQIICPEAIIIDQQLPSNVDLLKQFIIELVVSNHLFRDRCKETIQRLIEEKQIALHKNNLLEESIGIIDANTSSNFMDNLQFFQDENEKLSSANAFLKNKVKKFEKEIAMQEEVYGRAMAEVVKQQNERIQMIQQNYTDTHDLLLKSQAAHDHDLSELTRLKSISVDIPSKLFNAEIQSFQMRNNLMETRYTQVIADNNSLMDKFRVMEKQKALLEKENFELKSGHFKTSRMSGNDNFLSQLADKRSKKNEEDEKNGFVVFITNENGKRIKAATVEKLIDQLVDPIEYDLQFLNSFMFSYKLFIEPKQLLNNLIKRYSTNILEVGQTTDEILTPNHFRIINTLNFWVENYWNDFCENDEMLLLELESFIGTVQDTQLTSPIRSLIDRSKNPIRDKKQELFNSSNMPKPIRPKTFSKRFSTLELSKTTSANSIFNDPITTISNSQNDTDSTHSISNEKGIIPIDRPVSFLSSSFGKLLDLGTSATSMNSNLLYSEKLKFVNWDPLEVARQLTLIEFELFSAINCREFLDLAWMKPEKDILAPNIIKISKWSNHIVRWVISEIVVTKDNVKIRATIFEKMIMMAHHLDKLKNYNAVKEVMAGLQSSAVYRLKKTKEAIGSKYMKIYDDLGKSVSSELNYKNIRAKIQGNEPPLLPFPGLYQHDLVFLDTCGQNRIDGGLINFNKLERCSALILELQQFQKVAYLLQPVPELQNYITEYPTLDDDTAYNNSLLCEPRK